MGKRPAACPLCKSVFVQRDGRSGSGKQRYRCKVCGRGFVSHLDGVKPEVREIATALMLEGVPVPTIAKAMARHCSRRWLYNLRSSLIRAK